MATIYEMTEQAQELLELLTDGEIDEQTFLDTIEGMGAIDKVDNICKVINCLSADSQMFSNEIKRCQDRKRTIDNNITRLKKSLYDFYIASGQKQLKAGTFTISSRKSTAVKITNEEAIPMDYLTIPMPKANLTAIKQALKEGKNVPGAEIEERESVQIR